MRASIFADRLEEFGERAAVVAEGGATLTYAELAAAADLFATRLGGDCRLLVIVATNEIEPLVAYLGALRRRCAVLLLSGGDKGQHERILSTYRPDAIYAKATTGWELTHKSGEPLSIHPDLGVLLTTSGTTGAVKLVRLSRDAIDANAASIAEFLGIDSSDRAITSLQFHYSYGLSVVNSHLSRGSVLLLTDRSVIDEGFWGFFRRERATSLAGVPYTYDLLDRVGFFDMELPSLRTLTQAGGRLPAETAKEVAGWSLERGVRFFVMYGQTEATARMAYMPPARLLDHPSSIGVAIPGGSFRLADERGNTIDTSGVTGELVYRGPNVMMGYAQNVDDLARGHDLAELFTGDLASRDDEGLYYIVGRKSRFSKLYGLRISLDEIEAGLKKRKLTCAVAGDDAIIAVAIAGKADPEALAVSLAEEYGLPLSVFVVYSVEDLPALPSGKVDLQWVLQKGRELKPAAASTQATRSVRGIFEQAFPRQLCSAADSFVSLGGDSLNYVTLSLELEDHLGFLPAQWEELSIGELTAMARKPSRPMRWWSWRSTDTEVLLRALAILAVVINHASDLRVGGGAEALLMLYGFNLSRYQRGKLLAGSGIEVFYSLFKRIIVPYYVILLLYMLLWKQQADLYSLFLISNFLGRFASLLEPYWFLEVLFQCTAIVALLFAAPPVRRWAAHSPWTFAIAALATGLLLKVGAHLAFEHEYLGGRTPDAVLYLLAFGWALHQATTLRRRLLLTGLAIGIGALTIAPAGAIWPHFSYPANMTQALWFTVTSLSLLWLPKLLLPQFLRNGVGMIAGASFYIYLSHGVPVHISRWILGIENVTVPLVASVLAGILLWRAFEYVGRRARSSPPAAATE